MLSSHSGRLDRLRTLVVRGLVPENPKRFKTIKRNLKERPYLWFDLFVRFNYNNFTVEIWLNRKDIPLAYARDIHDNKVKENWRSYKFKFLSVERKKQMDDHIKYGTPITSEYEFDVRIYDKKYNPVYNSCIINDETILNLLMFLKGCTPA